MVHKQDVTRQLDRLGVKFSFFGNAELRELTHILVPNEQIQYCLLGRYESGFAVLCITDLSILLIDKKPLYLTLEDIRYDMVVEVDYSYRLINAMIKVCTPNKTLVFTAFKRHELRQATSFVQHRVLQVRQGHTLQDQFAQNVSPATQQQPAPTMPGQRSAVFEAALPTPSPLPQEDPNMTTSTLPSVTIPRTINPYVQSPLMIRRRVSRFGR